MKAILHINDKEELKTMLGRKAIKINLPKKKDLTIRNSWIMMIVFIFLCSFIATMTYNIGIHKGQLEGWNKGFRTGYDSAVRDVVSNEHLTLSDALAWNLRLHLDQYVAWFGVVIGLAWIFHGVGFHLVKL